MGDGLQIAEHSCNASGLKLLNKQSLALTALRFGILVYALKATPLPKKWVYIRLGQHIIKLTFLFGEGWRASNTFTHGKRM